MIGSIAPAAASGIGSLPGIDPIAAARLVRDELPELHALAELPARGPGAGLVGRTASMLYVDLPVDLQPAGWRLVDRPGADQRRAVSLLRQDLDALDEVFEGYAGPLKLRYAVRGRWPRRWRRRVETRCSPTTARGGISPSHWLRSQPARG